MTRKIDTFLATRRPATPCLVVDLDVVARNYRRLTALFPGAHIFYAVKANPAPEILVTLARLECSFDAASLAEIKYCLAAGAPAGSIAYTNTVKKEADIAGAFERGVALFAFDSEAELQKLARRAPGARVFCRIQINNPGAAWPLGDKFGCSVEMAKDLLTQARELGLEPYGVAFHVGSQQRDSAQWDLAIAKTALMFTDLRERGIELKMVNLGGGLPAAYRDPVPPLDDFAELIDRSLRTHFGNHLPEVVLEPGRALVADAGILEAEVVLVSRKDYASDVRWIYLDVGKYGGLAETEGEAIRYAIRTPYDDTPEADDTGPVVLAGPTCDGADVLYREAGYRLPRALKTGDRVRLPGTGAYTTTYASVGFNGFEPLKSYYI
ncbi:MAG: type III PLP-dependent enzyme [Alphaproteobacteria bacterium]